MAATKKERLTNIVIVRDGTREQYTDADGTRHDRAEDAELMTATQAKEVAKKYGGSWDDSERLIGY